MSSATKYHDRGTKTDVVNFTEIRDASAIQLISPLGPGALACGELWLSEKYKCLKAVKHGQAPEHHHHTFLPDLELPHPMESTGDEP
jgi:hypothetical protein